jgi:manganese/zinc/iron transport system permease protein
VSPQAEVQLIAVVVAVACAIPGAFLVLRRMSLVSDAISHSILPGIVLAFFVVGDLSSPLLLVAAAATGVLAVAAIEALTRTGLVRKDAAIGLVFPAMFSVGVILISRYAGSVHLDTDVVLLGELAFAPFDRLSVGGIDLGPKSLVTMSAVLLLNLAFLALFYKELQVATVDAEFAAVLGFSPALVHYALMGVVSVTAVGAFDAVGSILVVALMIAPPAAAYIVADRLPLMLALSAGIGAGSGVGGYWLARWLDASIAGSMATMVGIDFLLAILFAPRRGVIAQGRRRARQKTEFAISMLAIHLLHHEGMPEEETECHLGHLSEHLLWSAELAARIVRDAEREELLTVAPNAALVLTEEGRKRATRAMSI